MESTWSQNGQKITKKSIQKRSAEQTTKRYRKMNHLIEFWSPLTSKNLEKHKEFQCFFENRLFSYERQFGRSRVPKTSQNGAKKDQNGAQMDQNGHQWAPMEPKWAKHDQNGPKMEPKWTKMDPKWHIKPKKGAQRDQHGPQMAPKVV